MSKEFVRSVLVVDADENVPVDANLWPAIHGQVRSTEQALPRQHQPGRLRLAFNWKPLVLSGGFVLLLVAAGMASLLTQPATVSAEEVLARAEQAVKAETIGLQSFYGEFVSKYRNNPTEPFFESRQETWFQAPDQYAYKLTYDLQDGREYTLFNGGDGTYSYNYFSDYNQLMVREPNTFPASPTTGTLQALLFSPANFGDALESARRKLPPVRNPKSDPRPEYMYDVKLVGSEEVAGRLSYVLEMTLVPGASVQLPDRQVPEKMKMWVDEEVYAVLRLEGWDAKGNVLQSSAYESFQVNQGHSSNQSNIRSFLAAENADVLDLRLADSKEVEQAWQDTVKRASYQLFRPEYLPGVLQPGRPLYDVERGVTSQVFQGEVLLPAARGPRIYDPTPGGDVTIVQRTKPRLITLAKLAVIQGPPSSISEEKLGGSTPVQIGSLTGRLYTRDGGRSILIFDLDGTRIKLQAPVQVVSNASPESLITVNQLVQIAEAMQPVKSK
jgi:outer membrane lipoprotein-sorting protein